MWVSGQGSIKSVHGLFKPVEVCGLVADRA